MAGGVKATNKKHAAAKGRNLRVKKEKSLKKSLRMSQRHYCGKLRVYVYITTHELTLYISRKIYCADKLFQRCERKKIQLLVQCVCASQNQRREWARDHIEESDIDLKMPGGAAFSERERRTYYINKVCFLST